MVWFTTHISICMYATMHVPECMRSKQPSTYPTPSFGSPSSILTLMLALALVLVLILVLVLVLVQILVLGAERVQPTTIN